jgi:hypothetical protein
MEKVLENKFRSCLLEAIDETLASYGEPVKNQLYLRLEEDFSIRKNQIPEQIKLFSEFLNRTFGSAACLMQIKIMKTFNAKIAKEIVYNFLPINLSDDFSFVSYIQQMQLSHDSQKSVV